MKTIVRASTALLFVLVAACGDSGSNVGPSGSASATATAAAGLGETYEGNGYTIAPPAGWSVQSAVDVGADVVFSAGAAGSFASNINVRVDPAGGATLEEIVDQARTTLASLFTDYEFVDDTEMTVSGAPAHRFEATLTQGDNTLHNLQTIVLVDDQLYTVTATTTEAGWSEDEAGIRASLDSFQIS